MEEVKLTSPKRIAVLSGAGISAESGLKTFRDAGGLWEGYDMMEVASAEAWVKNPELVFKFYNERRQQLATVQPNAGHEALKKLEEKFSTYIITQNVDDLHERAGSKNILHLHGELTKMRSVNFENDIYEVGYQAIKYGSLCKKGALLRPHIVWFGEAVPMIENAIEIIEHADLLIVVGTSLEVYPAASLLHYFPLGKPVYLIDPHRHENRSTGSLTLIKNTAAKALPELVDQLLNLD